MTFTVIGPGIRDTIPSTKLLRPQGLRETQKTEPKKAIDDQDPDQSNQPNARKSTSATQAYKETNELFNHKLGITANEIMSHPVVTLTPNNTIENILEEIENHAFRHFPIVKAETQQLTGMISERDLLRHLANAHTSGEKPVAPLLTTRLDLLMSTHVLTASADTRIHELARLFVAQRISAIPIVEENTQVIGIITHSDVLRTLIEHNSLELWA
ncbi:hypothetical protein MNBD_GAMMA16-1429 [hydrothermal vent metagenome]|uniref:CBS domain-containing protein n=1 Tax=hydrothermal vent metagenome TaxID=652676 RepID=A0A3B0ZJQ4_9ZZZZ